MVLTSKMKKILLWALLTTLFAGLVYAKLEMSDALNKNAANAGAAGADLEMASLNTVKQSTSKPVNWKQERALRKKIDVVDAQYKQLVQKAQSEISSAAKAVSPATRDAGLDCAKRFQQASETYAAFWDKNNGKTRARLARETGKSRVKNAEMTFNKADSDRINAYNSQQEELAKARREYLAEAKTDVSPADRAALKAQSVPRMKSLATQLSTLATSIAALLNSIREQAGGMISGAVGGCSKAVTGGGGVDSGAAALVSPVTNLLNLVKSMGSNLQSTISDIVAM